MQRSVIIVCLTTVLIAGSGSAYGQHPFSFHNDYSYVDETQILRLLGEVRNDSDEGVREILVSASFFDSAGTSLGEFRRTAEYHYLGPGESSPFEILFLDQERSDQVANYTLSATARSAAEGKELQLQILSSNTRLDLLGTLYLNSVARNNGAETATNTLLVATLYDRNDKVIAIGRALAEAVRGTADVPAGSEAAFGVVFADKLQTYKGVKYSLLAQSDQYHSERVSFRTSAPGQTGSGGNQTQSGCLIATAAFGSEFAPQVQQLREFRDDIALKTAAGSGFMSAFNMWYYSFSPAVADYERDSVWARDFVRIAIQPLLAILGVGSQAHDLLLNAGLNEELAIMATGILSSSLIGAVYLGPVAVLVGLRKRPVMSKKAVLIMISLWGTSASLIAIGSLGGPLQLMMAGTSMLVLCCISTVVLALSDRLSRL